MNAIISLVVGKRYQNNFKRFCYANWKAYADRHCLELILFTKPIDLSSRAASRSAAWQKCLAVISEEAKRYKQVAWLDSDIFVNPSAPNIFDNVSQECIGAVGDFMHPSPEAFSSRLKFLEAEWARQGMSVVPASTPEDYYRAFPLPPLNQVAQTGVFVLTPELHSVIFRRAYEMYEDRGNPSFHYEMRPLSYEMVCSGKMTWLDPRFNLVPGFFLSERDLADFVAPYSKMEMIGRKFLLPHGIAISRRQRNLRRAYKELFQKSYFLHFAGRQFEMPLLS